MPIPSPASARGRLSQALARHPDQVTEARRVLAASMVRKGLARLVEGVPVFTAEERSELIEVFYRDILGERSEARDVAAA